MKANHYLLAFFCGLFSCQVFSSIAAPQSIAQIKDLTAMYELDWIVSHDYENTQKAYQSGFDA